ncbi:MAG: restriction endonuclease [Alphaproteobacteria bacterium]|nr:restriction endonuclease [Alphaproteobacteria bacterium]
MLPVLKHAAAGEIRISELVSQLADDFQLTQEERGQTLPSSGQSVLYNRAQWAKTYLKQAGLLEPTKRAHFRISERGLGVLRSPPERIDITFLEQFAEFRAFRDRSKKNDDSDATVVVESAEVTSGASPEDVLTAAHQQIEAAFIGELIDRLLVGTPAFFEKAIIELLLAMGYGGSSKDAGRAIGQSGDNGVDGVIDQDPLGVDQIYIQAKRYAGDNIVGASAIRDFFGALSLKKAQKGIFVTTSSFSKSARDTAGQLGGRIVLIDGKQLGRLMVRYNVGCRDKYTLHVKDFDEDFFD